MYVDPNQFTSPKQLCFCPFVLNEALPIELVLHAKLQLDRVATEMQNATDSDSSDLMNVDIYQVAVSTSQSFLSEESTNDDFAKIDDIQPELLTGFDFFVRNSSINRTINGQTRNFALTQVLMQHPHMYQYFHDLFEELVAQKVQAQDVNLNTRYYYYG